MKLVNQFFKEIKRLKDLTHEITQQAGVWPFGWSNECNPCDCFKRPDGLWEQYNKINTHMPHGGNIKIFLWRIDPNYCCAGRPIYTHDRQQQFLQNSETEKILVTQDNYEFVWKWNTIILPTTTCWGIKMGAPYYELRINGIIEIQTPIKAEFIRQYKALKTI